MLEDKWLILRFNYGDRGALHRLYDKYKDDLIRLAASLLLGVSAAGDVVHDAFLAFIVSGGRFRLTGTLMGYLLTCVANRNHNKTARGRQALQSTGMGRAGFEPA